MNITTFSRNEFVDTIPFVENTSQTLRTNGGILPNDRFMNGLLLEFRGRLAMPASTGPTALQGDSVAALIERVTVEGYHKVRRQQEKFIDIRGTELEMAQRFYLPSALMKLPTPVSVTASATNDMVVQILVPFTPLRMGAQVQAGYLLDAPNYESLKLTVQWGDFKSIVVAGATPPVWTAYGSGAGTPELRVTGQFALNKSRFANFVPGRLFRYSQEISGSIPTTTQTGARVWDIPRGFGVRSIMLKTGVKATTATAGNNTYASLSEFLTDVRINMGLGKYIRRYKDHNDAYADVAQSYNCARQTGVLLFDFCEYGNPGELLATRSLVSGPTGNVDLYVQADIAGAANQAILATIEEWRYSPIMAS